MSKVLFEFEPWATEPAKRYDVQTLRLRTREWGYVSSHHSAKKAIDQAVFLANQWKEPSRVVDTWAEEDE